MPKKHTISLFVAAVLFTPITVLAIVNWMEKKWNTLPVFKGENYTVTDFTLTNQYGQAVSLNNWKNKIVVVNFFFTHCPVICPKMTNNVKKIQAAFPDNNLLYTSFSVDPGRDSVQQLHAFADRFGINNNWHLLTGDKAIIYRLARKSFAVAAADGDDGEHEFFHSDKLVLLDAHQRIRGYYSGTSNKDVQQLINDIKKLHNEK